MKKLSFFLAFFLSFAMNLSAGTIESTTESSCNWGFDFYKPNSNQHYTSGSDIYVKVNAHRYQDIQYMELYINNQYIRKESYYPYEWAKPNSSGDNYLRNMQPGTYTLKCKIKDKCGNYHEKTRTIYIDNYNGGGVNPDHCQWGFDFYKPNCGQHYPKGTHLYVKVNAQKYQDIQYMELYVNNQYIRKESSYPYEWCKPNTSGDNYLRNMQPGTYNIKIKVKDKCGDYHEKYCVIYIDGNGGGGGNTCQWQADFYKPSQTYYPKGTHLYVKMNPQKYQDIQYMELYVNNQYIRKESHYPYEWCKPNTSGDNYLRNMQPGTYVLKCKIKDKCGDYHEVKKTIYIQN